MRFKGASFDIKIIIEVNVAHPRTKSSKQYAFLKKKWISCLIWFVILQDIILGHIS